MRDVVFGFVADLGTGEEWTARRGEGAFLDGRRLEGPGLKDEIEILSFEATTTAEIAARAGAMEGFARRLRVMGSLALSLCHLAAGRVDAVCSLKPIRSVDIAAAQLLCRERGLALDLPDAPTLDDHPLDLVGRSRITAGATASVCAELASRLDLGLQTPPELALHVRPLVVRDRIVRRVPELAVPDDHVFRKMPSKLAGSARTLRASARSAHPS